MMTDRVSILDCVNLCDLLGQKLYGMKEKGISEEMSKQLASNLVVTVLNVLDLRFKEIDGFPTYNDYVKKQSR